MFRILPSKNCVRRLKEVRDRAPFAHEFRVVANREVRTSAASACTLEDRNHQGFRGPRQHRAAENHNVMRFLFPQGGTDLARNLLNMTEVKLPATKAWSPHANE